MYKRLLKRIIDIVLSSIGIIVFAIPMFIVAVLIKIDSPGPVFFKQKRIGIHKTYFTIIKFRSMPISTSRDVPTNELGTDNKLTGFQKTIRKYSIDELPQLFCILTSKMSIIGPRPALWNQYYLISERDKYGANDVKPGLTGWAQINGRDTLTDELKAKFDGEYAKQLNLGGINAFLMDVKCFFGTVVKVIKHDGVAEGGIPKVDQREREIVSR